jgi:hypothetical protein
MSKSIQELEREIATVDERAWAERRFDAIGRSPNPWTGSMERLVALKSEYAKLQEIENVEREHRALIAEAKKLAQALDDLTETEGTEFA